MRRSDPTVPDELLTPGGAFVTQFTKLIFRDQSFASLISTFFQI